MHPQQAITRRRAVRRRREAARLTRSRARHLHVTTATTPLTAGAISFTVTTLDLAEAVMAAQFARTMDLVTARLGRPRYDPAHYDRETEERLHRFRSRHLDSAFSEGVEAVRAARALEAQLGPQRWTKLTWYGWVIVQGGVTGDQYRVDCSPPGNVLRQTDGVRMCLAHPSHDAPVAALLACQIFLLERDEPRFLSNANFLGIGGHLESIPPWTIEACCFPDRAEQARMLTAPPRRDIYARVPITREMLRYDPVLNVRDGQTDEARVAGILIEAPNEPVGPVAPYEPPEWDRGREWD